MQHCNESSDSHFQMSEKHRRPEEYTEYDDAFQWRGFPAPPPADFCVEDGIIIPVQINPDMYKTTNRDNYRQYGPDAYRAPSHEAEENEPAEHVPVDPNMYKSTARESYKPYDEDAYCPPIESEEEAAPEHVPVDPDMYKTTNRDNYRQYRPDAYRAPSHEAEENEPAEHVPVDPNMYKSTARESYKPYDEDAYCPPIESEEEAAPEHVPVDPDMYKTTNRDNYRQYGSDAYRASSVDSCKQSDDVSVEIKDIPSLQLSNIERPSSRGSLSRRSTVSSTARSKASSGRSSVRSCSRSSVCSSERDKSFVSEKPNAINAVRLPVDSDQGEIVTPTHEKLNPPKEKEMVRHANDPDHFVSTAMKDFGVPPVLLSPMTTREPSIGKLRPDIRDFASEYRKHFQRYPSSALSRQSAVPVAKACVHHVDPSFYTSTSKANYTTPPVIPVRTQYTRPTVTVRHCDANMYITSNMASYAQSN